MFVRIRTHHVNNRVTRDDSTNRRTPWNQQRKLTFFEGSDFTLGSVAKANTPHALRLSHRFEATATLSPCVISADNQRRGAHVLCTRAQRNGGFTQLNGISSLKQSG